MTNHIINTRGININLDALRRAAKETANWRINCGISTAIYYNRETGNVFTEALTDGSYIQWIDPAVIEVCRTARHHTAQWIADQIAEAVTRCQMLGI